MSKVKPCREIRALQVKPPCLERVWAVLRLCMLYPGFCLTTEEKHGKDISQGSPKVPVRHESVSHHSNLLVGRHCKFFDSSLPWDALEDLGQHWVSEDICQIAYKKGFHNSANFESNLLVTHLMCLAKERSQNLSEFVLPMYKDALMAMQRHLD
jgi:hypothetical protein